MQQVAAMSYIFLVIFLYISSVKCRLGMVNRDSCIVPDIPGGTVHAFGSDDDFSPVESGVIIADGTEIMIICNDGYDAELNELVDEDFSLKCKNGEFPFLPSCIPIPAAAHEAEISDDDSEEYDPETKILSVRRGAKGRGRRLRTKPCSFEPKDETVLVHHNGTLLKKNTTFPNGTILSFRCENISTFSFMGNSTRLCINQRWIGKPARCTRLYHHSFYSAPVVTYNIVDGEGSIREDGVVLVTDHSNVTLMCLWLRENSEPHWRKNGLDIRNQKKSPLKIKWNKKDDALELSIPETKHENSGYYVCNTPNRKMHGIHLLVIPRSLPEKLVDLNETEATNDTTTDQPLPTCDFSPSLAPGTFAYNGINVVKQSQSLESGTTLHFRCQDIFQFALEGNKTNECSGSQWLNQWPKCARLKPDSSDSPPPLDIQLTPSDKEYVVNDEGQLILPKDTTANFICKYTPSKPILALHGTKLRFTTGLSRSGATSGWYLRIDLPSQPTRFAFVCKIPRKDVDISHTVDVIVQNVCKLEEKKPHQKWRLNQIVNQTRNIYQENDILDLQCDGLTSTMIPTYIKCSTNGNWIQGPNQKCKSASN